MNSTTWKYFFKIFGSKIYLSVNETCLWFCYITMLMTRVDNSDLWRSIKDNWFVFTSSCPSFDLHIHLLDCLLYLSRFHRSFLYLSRFNWMILNSFINMNLRFLEIKCHLENDSIFCGVYWVVLNAYQLLGYILCSFEYLGNLRAIAWTEITWWILLNVTTLEWISFCIKRNTHGWARYCALYELYLYCLWLCGVIYLLSYF